MNHFIVKNLVLAWFWLCPLVCLFWLMFPRVRDRFIAAPFFLGFSILVCATAWLSMTVVLSHGFQHHLWFIPSNWGGIDPETGEFSSSRSAIASTFGFLTTIGLTVLLVKYDSYREKVCEMKEKLRVRRRLDSDNFENWFFQQCTHELDELKTSIAQSNLKPNQVDNETFERIRILTKFTRGQGRPF